MTNFAPCSMARVGEDERLRVEALLDGNDDGLRRFEAITGFGKFRQDFLKSSPNPKPVRSEVLVDLIGKLKAGDFSRPTADEEALEALDLAPSGDVPGRLGNHEVLDVIACGGMGIVFRARDPDLERLVAIKTLAPRFAKDPEARERFLSEARVVAALDHPNILPIHSVAEGEHVPYFVMRLVEGETLEDLVAREGPLPKKRALCIALQTARALAAAHAENVIHRDVKPANLLIEKDSERVWVADFGIAKQGAPEAAEAAGTPAFAAPEQLEGAPPTVQSDLYGLGATLRFALGGEVPKSLANLLAADPSARPESSEGVVRLLQRQLRSPIPRRLVLGSIGLLGALALVLSLTPLGITGSSNRALGSISGKPFYIEGKFGTHPTLAAALAAASEGDVLLLDFDGERAIPPTVVTQSHSIRAAPGRRPILVQQSVNPEMLKLKAPTELVGLTFVRPPVSKRPSPVIAAMFSKLTLRDCTLIALQDGHLAINSPLFSYGVPDIEIHDCRILTGQIRWYNMSAQMAPGNKQRGSLRISNSFISAARGPNLICKNIDVTVDLQNVTCLGWDLFYPQFRNGVFSIDARDSLLLAKRSVVWTPEILPDAATIVRWNGGNNAFSSSQLGFLRYKDESLADAEGLPFITQDSEKQVDLSGAWFVAGSIDQMRSKCATWIENARPILEENRSKGAQISVIEEFLQSR